MMVPWSSILLTVAAAVVASASPVHRRASGVIRSCANSGQVALTFDDGPSANLGQLVNILNSNGVKATFFFNGQNGDSIIANRQGDIQFAYNSGHQIASHTWSHAYLTKLQGDALNAEFSKTNDALKNTIGQVPAFVRPPYGDVNDAVISAAAGFNQQLVTWDFDSGDSTGKSPADSKQLYIDAANNYPTSILALNHETYGTTVNDVIPAAIQTLKAKGFQFVTVADCLNMSPYL